MSNRKYRSRWSTEDKVFATVFTVWALLAITFASGVIYVVYKTLTHFGIL